MHSLKFLVLCLLFALAIGAQAQPASSQPAATPAQGAGAAQSPDNPGSLPTVRVRTDEVNVVFTVVDKQGMFVKDLKQEQFRILDNNQPPQKILNFRAQTDLPLYVGLLIDSSNSIRDRFQFEKDAVAEFLYEVIRPKSDQAFILAFDETWDVTQDFTGDMDKLRNGIKGIKAGGGTALWDAVYFACRDKLMKEPAANAVRRAIILVSDGDDNQSRVLREEAIDMAQRAEVIIFTVSTSLVNNHTRGDDHLRALAEATGGRAFFPTKLDEVSSAFSEIQEELRSQYSISYRPDRLVTDGKFRPIQIIADNKKLKVRAKRGYFVPKP